MKTRVFEEIRIFSNTVVAELLQVSKSANLPKKRVCNRNTNFVLGLK